MLLHPWRALPKPIGTTRVIATRSRLRSIGVGGGEIPPPIPGGGTRDESAASATDTILVVDDGPGLLELVTELLSEDGHPVLVASSGEDALTMIRAVHPDLILLDYFAPDVSGLVLRPLEDG